MKKYVAAYHRLSRNGRGALWMVASAITFTVMTMLIKYLGSGYPSALQTFYRQAAGLVILLPIIARDPKSAFRTTRPVVLFVRALGTTVAMIMSFWAYQELPLADANALSFTRTLWLVPLAAIVLKEHVGPRRISATVIGFLGALLMVQPSADGSLGWPAIAALTSALVFAWTITGMKLMTRDHTTLTLMCWASLLGLAAGLRARHPTGDLRLAHSDPGRLLAARRHGRVGDDHASVLHQRHGRRRRRRHGSVDYTRLVFAIALGYALFREVPSALTMTGAAIIIGSTLYITIRESRLGVPKNPPARTE